MVPDLQSGPAAPGATPRRDAAIAGTPAPADPRAVLPGRFELPCGAREDASLPSPAGTVLSAVRSVVLRPGTAQEELDFDPPCALARSIRSSYGRLDTSSMPRFHTHA